MGIDISKTAIRNNKKIKKKFFYLKDICSKRFFLKEKFSIIYARFFLHAINSLSIPRFNFKTKVNMVIRY